LFEINALNELVTWVVVNIITKTLEMSLDQVRTLHSGANTRIDQHVVNGKSISRKYTYPQTSFK